MDFLAEEKNKYAAPAGLATKYRQEEVHRFIVDCMTSVATPTPQARALADLLVAADLRGHFTHGLNRLGKYGKSDVCVRVCVYYLIRHLHQTVYSVFTISLYPITGSNHYGIAGWYAMSASKQGLLGMSFTNTSSLVVPTRGKQALLGTNPISLAAPGEKGDDFVLDMATSVVSGGKVEVACVKGEGVPAGWALDRDGAPTTDAERALDGFLLPLGGDETHSGYKGFGLGMMVEIFCGILTGAPYGSNIRDWTRTDRPADLSQCFVAIDPSFFAPGFEGRMTDLMNHCRNMEPETQQKPVLVAGDPERLHMRKVEQEGGITYHINQINNLWKLAKYLGVTPLHS
ncbi:(2R)-3-sulfolactate dehydrogenase (NADP(+))-like [Penaeus indicus]|uniref:(2R)-3-sulfolactate dehydrogenase (NADP(+))-like n=1 Tax=Penaeus indicus TaxID=29960 RepID=UPI00300CA6FF